MDSDGDSDGDNGLIDRAVARLSPPPRPAARWRAHAIDWRFAFALTGVIALAPLLTIFGAGMLERAAVAEAARLHAKAAPRLTAEARDRAARDLLRGAVRDAPVAVWLDRVAAALPPEARIARMARVADGGVELDVAAPDPDALRAAIRRDVALAGFRETGQRRAGAMILVRWRKPA